MRPDARKYLDRLSEQTCLRRSDAKEANLTETLRSMETASLTELLGSEIMTPAQWYPESNRESPHFHGTKQLMLAVLVDALQCLQNDIRRPIARLSFAEAEMWINDRKGQGPFAFETVCETLGINAERLRDTLDEWSKERLSGRFVRRQIRHSASMRRQAVRPNVRRRRKAKQAPKWANEADERPRARDRLNRIGLARQTKSLSKG